LQELRPPQLLQSELREGKDAAADDHDESS